MRNPHRDFRHLMEHIYDYGLRGTPIPPDWLPLIEGSRTPTPDHPQTSSTPTTDGPVRHERFMVDYLSITARPDIDDQERIIALGQEHGQPFFSKRERIYKH